jgi:hypothetical protein
MPIELRSIVPMIQHALEAGRAFEYRFDHLASGFDAGLPANVAFSQWVSILPTDQSVAAEYTPTVVLTDA